MSIEYAQSLTQMSTSTGTVARRKVELPGYVQAIRQIARMRKSVSDAWEE